MPAPETAEFRVLLSDFPNGENAAPWTAPERDLASGEETPVVLEPIYIFDGRIRQHRTVARLLEQARQRSEPRISHHSLSEFAPIEVVGIKGTGEHATLYINPLGLIREFRRGNALKVLFGQPPTERKRSE